MSFWAKLFLLSSYTNCGDVTYSFIFTAHIHLNTRELFRRNMTIIKGSEREREIKERLFLECAVDSVDLRSEKG
jgi:hypothetical protein